MSARRRALVIAFAGATSVGLLAPVAATTASAATTSTQAHAHRRIAQRAVQHYTAVVAGPRATAPEGDAPFGTSARGISTSGTVFVLSRQASPSLVNPRTMKVTALPPTGGVSQYPGHPEVLAPSGVVYGGGHDGLFEWSHGTVRFQQVQLAPQTNADGFDLVAADARGDVAGCTSYYRVSNPVYGTMNRGTARTFTWPKDAGNCEVTGMSSRGVATVNQTMPNFRTSLVYPRAATMTAAGVRYLKAPEGVASSADAISPNGRYIVGRTFREGVATVSWLSGRTNPAPVRGAGTITPRFVTDAGVVYGTNGGRVVMLERGRTTDLTGVTRLPRGWVLTSIDGINARGQIAVTATLPGGRESVAMRLDPTGRR